MKKFSINSEIQKLESIIIGSAYKFHHNPSYVESVNLKQQTLEAPMFSDLRQELQCLKSVLKENDIEVYTPDYVGGFVPDQLTPRDIGFVIGDKFVLSNLTAKSRRFEAFGILKILTDFDISGNTVLIPERDAYIEGGDIIVNNDTIYVGLSNRTNNNGLEFIIRNFSDRYRVVSIPLNDKPELTKYLHLDCVFNPVGSSHALYFSGGISEWNDSIGDSYQLIEVTAEEQAELAINILTISPDTIITRKHTKLERVNSILREFYKVIEIKFDSVVATGGSIRCATLPLVRSI